ncbi:MAG TPA: NAD(P)H-dependent oxidoreductase [Xanthobacteraceae bacterium]|nr:NAD(P)H-dependent oxidoreductase [Xanthobacteraceae bacterium]
MARITLIQGHPTADARHFCHALADSYREGAQAAGHEVRDIEVARLDFPVLRARSDWESAPPTPDIAAAQEDLSWADHLVLVYPLWLGTMPALVKAFLEQALRPGFAVPARFDEKGFRGRLQGKSARIIVTMGMPAWVYRWYFLAHGLKSLERSILGMVGVSSRHTLIGSVEAASDARRQGWLDSVRRLGAAAN